MRITLDVTNRYDAYHRWEADGLHEEALTDIEKAEIFRVLAPLRLARIKPHVHQRRFEARKVIFFEGSRADRIWFVRSGQVRLYKASARSQITTLDVLREGEVFGALTTAEDDAYPSSAEAVTGGRAWWLPRTIFLKLLADEPAVAMEVLEIVWRRLRHAQDRLRAFAYDLAPARLAHALLESTSGEEANVTRRALAEASGTSVETAIRVLRRFEVRGLIRGEVGLVAVLDRSELERIASGK